MQNVLADLENPGRPAFWRQPEHDRRAAFARLRQVGEPVVLEKTRRRCTYGLVRHQDITTASRRPDIFRNAPGATTPPPARWVRALFGPSMVNLDGPEHARLRGVVARAFTPRVLARAEENIRQTAHRIITGLPAGETVDFVDTVAAPMPFEVLCTMMGIPAVEREQIRALIDQASQHTGVQRGVLQRLRSPGRGLRALAQMHRIVARIGRERRQHPGDDLISRLVAPDRDGNHLTSKELGAFFSLLLVAGVETTRNALAHGMHLLTTHPEQRALITSDPDRYLDTAVEEIIRYSTPIHQFRRTITQHNKHQNRHQTGHNNRHQNRHQTGHNYTPGDNVILFYGSANRDETIFTNPDTFDITRHPNPHLGFGGGGPHYCLGAHLARQEIHTTLHTLLTHYPNAHTTAPPHTPTTNFDHRITQLPFHPTTPKTSTMKT